MRRILPFLACVICFASTALADDSVTLKLSLNVGQSWTFDQTEEMNSSSTATMNGQSQQFASKMSSHRIGKAEVMAASNGVPSSIKFTFDANCEIVADMPGQQPGQRMPFPYAGRSVTVTRGADGNVTDDANLQVAPDVIADLHQMLEQEHVLFSDGPVAVNQEWKGNNQDLARMLQLQGPNDRGGMTVKLLSLQNSNGRPTAELKVSLVGYKEQQGLATQVITQGTATIDVQTGHAMKIDLAGTMEQKGDPSGPGPDGQPATYHVEGKGTTKNTSTSSLIGVANQPAPVPAPVNNNGGGGAAPVNPLAGPRTFAGRYSDGKLTLDFTELNGAYTGTITLNGQQFPASAKQSGANADGSFQASGANFPFNIVPTGDNDLTLTSGGKVYTLKRVSPPAPVNPLGGGGAAADPNPQRPQVVAAPAGSMPTNYQIVKQSPAGVALIAHRPQAASAREALGATCVDLRNYFGASTRFLGAYEDGQSHQSGGVTFAATWRDKPVQGFISATVKDQTASIAILFCRNDAPVAERMGLTQSLGKDAGAGLDAAAKSVHLTQYQFPDNTGTMGVADGWSTNAQSEMQVVEVNGPDDARLILGVSTTVVTPNSQAVQTYRQLIANSRIYHNPVPPQYFVISPIGKPGQVFSNALPQFSQMSGAKGGPTFTVSDYKVLAEPQPVLQGGEAAVVSYNALRTADGRQREMSALVRIDLTPISADTMLMSLTQMVAPQESFVQHLPEMVAMVNSVRENVSVIAQKSQENIDAMNARFAAQQRAQKELTAAYEEEHKQYYRDSNARSRSFDDFDETIRGNRTVLDSVTGEKTSVDLGNVDGIVNAMNEGQPGRYVQIPLRDEADPLVR